MSVATQAQAEVVVVGVHAGSPPTGLAAEVDRTTGGLISRLIEQKEISGKKYELTTLIAPANLSARQLVVVGLGAKDKFETGTAYRVAAAASRHVSTRPRGRVEFLLDDNWQRPWTEAGLCGAMVGCYGQDLYRAEKNRHPFTQLFWAGGQADALASGRILAESVNLTRRLVNEPPDDMYPESFAAEAQEVAKECGLEIEVWDAARLEQERCGSLLAVAKGSSKPARLVMLRHNGGPKGQAPVAIVGKGVTFDSGGLSLKPSDGMLTMKCDMAGAATMLGAMRAISQLKLPVNVIGMAGLVENMIGPAAMKLGDVLKARNGRTIEVHNTDAEGRLVLADVLSVAIDLGVERIVDLATLTGACIVGLGTEYAGLMTNDQSWCDRISAAAAAVGETVWQLPMDPEVFDDLIKSEVADIKNVGDGRSGGAITAAKFLEQFVAGRPWTHIDIAGPAFRDKPKPWADGGATGTYVRTLVELVRRMA